MSGRRLAALAAALLALVEVPAGAVPSPGAPHPEVQLEDAWDRTIRLSQLAGTPILVVYEDRGSAHVNDPLKSELSELAKGDKYKQSIALVAVADVSSFDFWPARGFVKGAIRSESHKQGTTIYCDWDGHVRRALGLDRGTSNVVLFGRDGRVLFAQSGTVAPEQRRALIGMLHAIVTP